jgi:hypothetical protein
MSEWISVDDRLPDIIGRYDCVDWSEKVRVKTSLGVEIDCIMQVFSGEEKEQLLFTAFDSGGVSRDVKTELKLGEIVSWMPLPEPPAQN